MTKIVPDPQKLARTMNKVSDRIAVLTDKDLEDLDKASSRLRDEIQHERLYRADHPR